MKGGIRYRQCHTDDGRDRYQGRRKSSSESGDFSPWYRSKSIPVKALSHSAARFGNAMPRLVLKDGLRLEGYLDVISSLSITRMSPGSSVRSAISWRKRISISPTFRSVVEPKPGEDALRSFHSIPFRVRRPSNKSKNSKISRKFRRLTFPQREISRLDGVKAYI